MQDSFPGIKHSFEIIDKNVTYLKNVDETTF